MSDSRCLACGADCDGDVCDSWCERRADATRPQWVVCGTCEGSGEVLDDYCRGCGGEGAIPEELTDED